VGRCHFGVLFGLACDLCGSALGGSHQLRYEHPAQPRPVPRRHPQLGCTLLATCVFLLIPESLELLAASAAEQDAHAAETEFANTTTNDTSVATHDDHDHFLLNHYLQEAQGELHTDQQGFAWKFGASLLGGFLFPILLHAFFPSPAENCEECQQHGDQVTEEEGTPLGAAAAADKRAPHRPRITVIRTRKAEATQ
jgi:hypothetical protein